MTGAAEPPDPIDPPDTPDPADAPDPAQPAMTDTSTADTSLETIGGVPVALTDGAAATVLTWIEPPLGPVVVSADAATGRQTVESILAGSAPSPTP